MKRLLLATTAAVVLAAPAFAADLPVAMPTKAPAYVPAWSWTGFYIGGNVGGGWANESGSATLTTPAGGVVGVTGTTGTVSGVIGGGQIGYNWQFNQFVLGVEGDFDGSGERATANGPCFGALIPACTFNASAGVNWFATARARAGWAADRWLFYVTGGAAWQNTGANAGITVPAGTFGLISTSTTRSGWVAGVGVEYAMWDHFILGAEYLHIDTGNFGSTFVFGANPFVPVGSVLTTSSNTRNDIVRARLSYKF